MEMDLDQHGKISLEELKLGYRKIFGEAMSEEAIEVIFNSIDKDCSGYIDY